MWFSSLGARIRPYFWFSMIIEYVFVLTCRNRNNSLSCRGIGYWNLSALEVIPFVRTLISSSFAAVPIFSLPLSLPSYGAWAYSWLWALGSLPAGVGCCMECWRLNHVRIAFSFFMNLYFLIGTPNTVTWAYCASQFLSLRSLILSGLHCNWCSLGGKLRQSWCLPCFFSHMGHCPVHISYYFILLFFSPQVV